MITRQQSRDADARAVKHFRIPSLVLMENAGRSCADKLIWHSPQGKTSHQAVLILCGPGNNGGDGFVMARHLYTANIPVKVVLFRKSEAYKGDALVNLNALSQLRLPVVEFDSGWSNDKLVSFFSKVKRNQTTWVVDALLGTGAQGKPEPEMAKALKVVNELNVRRMAIDIPTGLDSDTGKAAKSTFVADLTCTFISPKVGFGLGDADKCTGVVTLVDIGAPDEIIRDASEDSK